ncbi:hypothetical protein [Aliarcobacter butzleri]|uniref:hypothetical protein n=1 Tax=Aliarcobacter butzleri TaxID=28197 RepID=UPI002B254538|nr:hypothetical protein [Aliarcobacter butzleri]
MSNYKVEFTLKQHTPIIHFQSDQIGATLRATELKPKFDRFLLKLKDSKINPSKGLQNELFFNYKIKITTENLQIDSVDKYNKFPPLYFARDKKQFSIAKLKIEFISFDTNLISVIKETFPKFLAITNFGSRSSKGYGSFLDEKTMPSVFIKYAKEYYPKIYKLEKKVQSDTWEKIVGDFHKMLKMGNNHPNNPNLYKKAYLWEYFAQKGIRWEKRQIKKEFPNLAFSKRGNKPLDVPNPKDDNFRFIRAMLGLAGQYEFRIPSKEIVTIECNDKSIERMRSPLEFKVIGDTVYILCNEHYKKLYGKSFTFTYKKIKSFEINAPKQNEFELYDFMDYLVQKNIIKAVI